MVYLQDISTPANFVCIMPKQTPKQMPKQMPRLSREEWLTNALDVLAVKGGKLTIDSLVDALGVTKGSFYWHFKNREEFINAVSDYWYREYTEKASQKISKNSGSPEDRLLALMMAIKDDKLARYDLVFRSWATQEPSLIKQVKKVDTFRLKYIRSLFAEMGFKDQELEMRTHLFTVYHSMEHFIIDRPTKEQELVLLKKRHAFFIKK